MLDALEVRILSGLAAMGVVVGFLLVRSQGSFVAGGFRDVRAERPVPLILEVAWVLVVIIPVVSLFVAAASPELVYSPFLPIRLPGDVVLQFVGYGILAVGGFLLSMAIRHLGPYMVIQIAVSEDHKLVTSGPYARIRHPAYTSLMLMSLGGAMFFLSVVLLVDFLVVLVIANYRARIEESLLSSPEGFGLQYRAYVARTGRFLPRLRSR